MKEKTEKDQTSQEKKKRNKTRALKKPSAVSIWIVIEAVAVIIIAAAAIIRNVYGGSMDQGREYTIPTEETKDVSIDDIELPTDLMADSEDDVEATVGNVYDMDYSEEVLNILSETDNFLLIWFFRINSCIDTIQQFHANKDVITGHVFFWNIKNVMDLNKIPGTGK